MQEHIGLRVVDLEASVRFYAAALAPLGYELCSRDASIAGLGRDGEPGLWLHAPARSPCSVHVLFLAGHRAAVERFYCEGLKAGGRDHCQPRLRLDYGPRHYAAFLLDPDGNTVEVACLRAA